MNDMVFPLKEEQIFGKCKKIKALSFFNINQSRCKDCANLYNKEYTQNNKEAIAKRVKEYKRNRTKNDPLFKLRKTISNGINKKLKNNGCIKNDKCFIPCIEYTLKELFLHIEKQFEPWMNWKNRGNYNPKTWNDNDPKTWTWQLDHIIPHSTFHYTTMDCQEFRDCWALSNLRPLSAKQNVIDGNRRKINRKDD
jgi:hypothetical protein